MRIFTLALLVLLFPLFVMAQEKPVTPSEFRVLFIGNSLTYTNDLPTMVKAIAEHNKKKFKYKMVAHPNFSLEDHLNQGDAVKAIKEGKWNFVVLQQGSSALPDSRKNLIEFTQRFNEEIKRIKAKPALFMVWTFQNRMFDFDRVRESYSLAAKEVDGLFLPAGESWRFAWKRKPELELYSDSLHPTPLGSYLAAAVIYQRIYGEASVKLPAKLKTESVKLELSSQEIEMIEASVMEANEKYGK